MIPTVSYTEPELCTYEMDLSRPWFVYFDITNELTGVTLRKQFRGGINYFKTEEERLRRGRAVVKFWKDKLDKGSYNPFKTTLINPVEHPTNLQDAVVKVLELKKSSIKPRSYSKYNEVSGLFLKWCTGFSYHKIRPYQYTCAMAQAYLDYLLVDRGHSGKTHNNQLDILNVFFNAMAKKTRRWITENPFTGIEKLPEDVGNNQAYTDKEREILRNHFLEHDKRMYYATNFLFHGFIRKTELCSIRVGAIDWENKTIKINSRDAKNRIQDSVTIPEGFLKILYEMGLDLAPKHYYIFGKNMQTCEDRCTRPDDISERHLALKLAAGLPPYKKDGKAFYSWKHTGVVAYWKVVKDIYFMMRQLRHHDMETTMIYLKSLGLMPNEAFRDATIVL